MKQIFTFFIAVLLSAAAKTTAQVNCNPAFTKQYVTANTIKFTPAVATDSPLVQHSWNFGDWTFAPEYNYISPAHVYTSPGVYTVTHRIVRGNPNGVYMCSDSSTQQVIIQGPCNITAAFSAQQNNAANPLMVWFTNNSEHILPTDSTVWSFGDGTFSYDYYPFHTYTTPGTYNVCLKVKQNNSIPGALPCRDSICHTVTIASPCNLTALFSTQTDPQNPLHIYFANNSTGFATGDSIRWTFGDGTVSYDLNPSHTYANAGTYNVCLRVKKNSTSPSTAPCVSEYCHQVVVTQPCNLTALFATQTDPQNPLHIYFSNNSTGFATGDSIRWTFGDGTVSYDLNPSHTYANAGTYNVCLRVKKNSTSPSTAPCVSEYCHQVVVTQPCNLTALFATQTDPQNPLHIYFANNSTGFATGDSIRWTFGDGTVSYDLNPSHTYANAGTYNVCLRVKKNSTSPSTAPCVSEYCHQVVVTAPAACNLTVNYNYLVDSLHPYNVYFTNTSTGYASGDTLTWTFGDGSISHDPNVMHNYAVPGTYHVCLLIKKANTPNCIREKCYSIVIPETCNLTAGFTFYRDSTTVSIYTYHFQNTSVPLTTYDSVRWSFGDGTFSNTFNPNHVYAQPGTYNVCLRVQKRTNTGALTNCVREVCHTVTVAQVCTLQPSFTWRRDSLNYKKIYFTNTTTAPATNITATWYFGDGTTAASWNAVHEYAQAGRYSVCLRIQYGNCVVYKCDSITVVQPSPACAQLSNYHFVRSATDSQTYVFTPNYISNDIQYTWTFGDGTGSHDINATHHFATAGYYTVCLTAYKNANCASTTCNGIQVHAQPSCGNITIDFNDHRDSLVPNRITFTAYSNTTITDQVWTITKYPATAGTGTATIHQNNPTYVFIDTGYYRVCLRASFANGCVKEYCDNIYISQTMPGVNSCTLQAYPNPAGASVNVNIALAQPLMLNGYIYNSAMMVVGQKQQQGVVGNNVFNMNTANLPAGIYTIKIIYGNQLCAATFVKQ